MHSFSLISLLINCFVAFLAMMLQHQPVCAALKPSVGTDDQGQQLWLVDNSTAVTLNSLLNRLAAAESRITLQNTVISAQQSTIDTLLQQAVFDSSSNCSGRVQMSVVQKFSGLNPATLTSVIAVHYLRIATSTGVTDYDHFLAVGGSGTAVVYKFDATVTKRFVMFQSLATRVVYDFDSFTTADGRTFLLQVDANNPTATSVMYLYNGTRFNIFQSITHPVSHSAKFFATGSSGTVINLAISSALVGATDPSTIYRYNSTTNSFVLWRTIATSSQGLGDFEVFVIDGATYLMALPEDYAATPSTLYRYNAVTDSFDVAQSLDTRATSCKFFSFNGQSFLAVNRRNVGAVEIYKWTTTSTTASFQIFQNITASCSYQTTFFQNRQDFFLVLSLQWSNACFSGSGSGATNSMLMRFNGTQFVQVATSFPTFTACQTVSFTISGATYVAMTSADPDLGSADTSALGGLYQLTKQC